MLPTLNTKGDFVLINKTRRSDPQPGDIIMSIAPTDPSGNIIKRVRFVAGDTIVFEGLSEKSKYTVPQGYVWIEGDNLETSFDSRSYGAVPLPLIKGTVICRLYPFSLLDTPAPPTTTVKLG
eukprot:gene15355-18214_t